MLGTFGYPGHPVEFNMLGDLVTLLNDVKTTDESIWPSRSTLHNKVVLVK